MKFAIVDGQKCSKDQSGLMTQKQAWDKLAAAKVSRAVDHQSWKMKDFLIEIVVCISVKYHFPNK